MTDPTVSVPAPDFLVPHARQFHADGLVPAVPRRAATVLLLREAATATNPTGFEVYLLRRAATMPFASGVYAYPGGRVDPRDESVAVEWAGPSPQRWGVALGLDPAGARAVLCAAVREVFEETGVLLAGDVPATDAGTTRAGEAIVDLEAERAALVAGELGLAELLRGLDLPLRSDLLAPWARWITPVEEPRRYDTWFFLARLPRGQRTRDVSGEADHTVWLRPDAAGDLIMLPPTRMTLDDLASYPSINAAMAAPRDAATPVTPWVEFDGDQARLVIPDLPRADPSGVPGSGAAEPGAAGPGAA